MASLKDTLQNMETVGEASVGVASPVRNGDCIGRVVTLYLRVIVDYDCIVWIVTRNSIEVFELLSIPVCGTVLLVESPREIHVGRLFNAVDDGIGI